MYPLKDQSLRFLFAKTKAGIYMEEQKNMLTSSNLQFIYRFSGSSGESTYLLLHYKDNNNSNNNIIVLNMQLNKVK